MQVPPLLHFLNGQLPHNNCFPSSVVGDFNGLPRVASFNCMTPLGIIELLKLALRVWLAVNVPKPFQRLYEIDREIYTLSLNANEACLLQIEILDRERRILVKLIGTLHADLNDKS